MIDSDAASHTDDRRRDSRRDILFGIGAAVAAVLLVWLLYTIRDTLLLIYVSALLAMRISPLVGAIERQRLIPFGGRLPRWVAILIIYSATVGGVMVVGALVLPSLVAQAEALRRDLPDKLSEAQQVLLSAGVLRPITTLNEAVEQAPVSDGATALTTLWLTLRNVMGGVLGLVTVLLLTFYMLVESRELRAFFVRLFPPRARARVKLVSGAVVSKVSAWMSAQALLAVIIGLTSALGLWIMGVPYFYVLAVISAVGELIPMVGPLVAAIPAVLVAATVSTGLAIGVTIFFIAQQQLENTVLVPKIMGHQVGLGAVTVIVALAIGTQLFGILGAVLSVPTAAIVQVLFDELVARDD